MKRELLESDTAAVQLTDQCIECDTAKTALRALWAEVRRCQAKEDVEVKLDYDVCLAALGGSSFSAEEEEADLFTDLSFMASERGDATDDSNKHKRLKG